MTICGVRNCTNEATHTWSGHPTCDDCGTPGRKAGSKTNLERFTENRDNLLVMATNERNHLLDRVDAYLELSQLCERDNYKRAQYVQAARELIAKDL